MLALQMILTFTGVAAGISLPSFSLERSVVEERGVGCPAGSTPANVTICTPADQGLCQCSEWLLSGGFDYCGNPTADPSVGYNPIYPTAFYPGGCQNGYCQECTITCPCLLKGHL